LSGFSRSALRILSVMQCTLLPFQRGIVKAIK
jgi:hypothetical protein